MDYTREEKIALTRAALGIDPSADAIPYRQLGLAGRHLEAATTIDQHAVHVEHVAMKMVTEEQGLRTGVEKRRQFSKNFKLEILDRELGMCHWCEDCIPKNDTFAIDHHIPLVHGGSNHERNLFPACLGCNSSKHAHAWFRAFTPQLDSVVVKARRWVEPEAWPLLIGKLGLSRYEVESIDPVQFAKGRRPNPRFMGIQVRATVIDEGPLVIKNTKDQIS